MEAALRHLRSVRYGAVSLLIVLCCFRFAHVHLLRADEEYHLAAALQILHGKIPYLDFWYDKPPLSAIYYLAIGGDWGWPLRLLDAAYMLAACALVYRLARVWWGEAEAWTAALLLGFFTTFYLPSAVIPFAADALMLVPHLAAIYCAARRRSLWAGIWCGIAFLVNPKALFAFAVCAIWLWPDWLPLLCGFAIPILIAFLCALGCGAWHGYLQQVWAWGFLYAEGSPVSHPFSLGVVRTADWLGFHAALTAGAIFAFTTDLRGHRRRMVTWLALSFAAVCLGTRFAPHYFFQLLPAMVIAATPGIVGALRRLPTRAAAILAMLLLVPLIRFGPRYFRLAYDDLSHRDPQWPDVALDLDSQQAARMIRSLAHPGDTLFVWGYRPDVYVYTRLIPPGLFWDSQPLTGVPADRHLSTTQAIYGGPAAGNRQILIRSDPTFLVDGLGLLNPKLRPGVYPELRPWLAHYRLVASTKLSLIYRRIN